MKYRDSETPRLRMTLQEAKAIWVSFVGVLKVHNALEIKATFLKQLFPKLLPTELQDPTWGSASQMHCQVRWGKLVSRFRSFQSLSQATGP